MTYSVTDLVAASTCEYQAVRSFELKSGWRLPPCGFATARECTLPDCPAHSGDGMADRLAQLGDAHEMAMLNSLIEEGGEWDGTGSGSGPENAVFRADLVPAQERAAATAAAFAAGVKVLFQVDILDGELKGRADFVIRQPDGTYAVYDTKLARTARASAVLQITAYAQALGRQGVPISRFGYLMLGTGEISRHNVADTEPVFRRLRSRYEDLVQSRSGQALAQWGVPDSAGRLLGTCGRCSECEQQVSLHDDVLLVMGTTTAHRVKLNQAGVFTVADLAHLGAADGDGQVQLSESSKGIDISRSTLTKLVAQAQLVLEGREAAAEHPEGLFRVFDTKAFGLLKPESEGDIFFDFEGDPLYAEAGSSDWGLEYLFGWCTRRLQEDGRPAFHALWAHDRAEEKRAFEQFIDYLMERIELHPDMHVYHYAPYETTALKRLAVRHGTREEALDAMLRRGLFVDLYAVVRGTMRASGHSLSIKKLEPFYADALGHLREGVTNAVDSITEYASAVEAREAGRLEQFEELIGLIEQYNRYDCESTYHLLNWVGGIAESVGVDWRVGQVQGALDGPELEIELSAEVAARVELSERLAAHLARFTEKWQHDLAVAEARGLTAPEPEARMITRMAWAGLEYNRRENKQYWWAHFARLSDPIDEWTGSDIFRPVRAEVVEEWHKPPRARTLKRVVRLYGELEPGNKLAAGTAVCALYDEPYPLGLSESANGIRGYHFGAVVTEIEPIPGGGDAVALTILESAKSDQDPWHELPVGLGPGTPIATVAIDARLEDFAREVLAALEENPEAPEFADTARTRLLRRMGTVADAAEDNVATILAALRSDDPAVVAVQGPPGAGKTYVASHVITTLAKAGWHIGVVAQSHAVVENVLHAVLKRGMLPEAIAKKPKDKPTPESPWPFQLIDAKSAADFFANASTGTVTGGTAWSYSSLDFAPPGGYDLLVIDEAGQFSMANSLAVSHASKRVLLLGDPQQLPQVSQGDHPEPVDGSALSWLVGDDATIHEDRGFFLDQTWRMHPDLTSVVSELSYEGKLFSVPGTAERFVDGIRPGLHTVAVEHSGNTVQSPQEADAVIGLIKSMIGRQWQEDASSPRKPLTPEDFIVVAPYNAQVQLLKDRFAAEGWDGNRVGTVDKFQGQEAPVALVSLAVSDAENTPRGLDFVRNRNRLNVSISRGKHSAFLIHSPALLDTLPGSIQGMEEQGAFIRLSESGQR
ncbi:TM0106 family RecB-like putative nuclease [Timonella senegalensis]|uniref:TM0106 family RecB-like putative nuclease n=1 Tax=Timonella senegalensis TaxID=1465825 RepID=UPI002FDD4318